MIMVLLLGIVSFINGQTTNKMDPRALLTELDSMLTEIPATKEACEALLNHIKAWQEQKLRELTPPRAMLNITTPSDKAQVPDRPLIEGTVADPNAGVWVIVHPMEVSDYWVQPSVSVKEDGTWKVKIYVGRPEDVGKQFEIMAVANPRAGLKEGDKHDGWPEAQWKSQVIEVTRR